MEWEALSRGNEGEGGRRSCITRLFVMVSLSLSPHLISSTPAAQMIVVAAVTRARAQSVSRRDRRHCACRRLRV